MRAKKRKKSCKKLKILKRADDCRKKKLKMVLFSLFNKIKSKTIQGKLISKSSQRKKRVGDLLVRIECEFC